MKHFDEAATRAPLAFERLVPALRSAFAAEAQVPPRHVHTIETAGAAGGACKGTVLIMPAWSDAGFLGIKTINIFPGNGARGLPGLHATYVLYDARTGVPLAMMDGNEITARRTAAASALGASFLARKGARRLLVLGTGRIARMQARTRQAFPPTRCTRRLKPGARPSKRCMCLMLPPAQPRACAMRKKRGCWRCCSCARPRPTPEPPRPSRAGTQGPAGPIRS